MFILYQGIYCYCQKQILHHMSVLILICLLSVCYFPFFSATGKLKWIQHFPLKCQGKNLLLQISMKLLSCQIRENSIFFIKLRTRFRISYSCICSWRRRRWFKRTSCFQTDLKFNFLTMTMLINMTRRFLIMRAKPATKILNSIHAQQQVQTHDTTVSSSTSQQ